MHTGAPFIHATLDLNSIGIIWDNVGTQLNRINNKDKVVFRC